MHVNVSRYHNILSTYLRDWPSMSRAARTLPVRRIVRNAINTRHKLLSRITSDAWPFCGLFRSSRGGKWAEKKKIKSQPPTFRIPPFPRRPRRRMISECDLVPRYITIHVDALASSLRVHTALFPVFAIGALSVKSVILSTRKTVNHTVRYRILRYAYIVGKNTMREIKK